MSNAKIRIVNNKVYKSFSDSSTIFKEYYFLRELNHPNITKLTDVKDPNNGVSQIIMEYSGKSLSFGNEDYSEKIAKIDNLILTMVDILNYLRSQKIVHNDIKPANITLSNNKFSLIDFGSAILFDENKKFNSTSYTIPYAAPEVLTNSAITDPYKIDIWSLGVTVLELLLGKNILDGEKVIPVFRNMLKYFAMDDLTLLRLTFPEIDLSKYCKSFTILPQFYGKFETDIAKIKKLDLLKDLLIGMLIMNPDRRFGIEEITKHDYYILINKDKKILKYQNTILKNIDKNKINLLYN